MVMKYLQLMRVKHYLKNLLVFFPLIFSGRLLEGTLLTHTVLGTLGFCLLTSAVYILNDWKDVASDRQHPTKCKRPLASGAVSLRTASVLMGVLLVGAAGLNALSGGAALSWVTLGAYFGLNLLYSCGLKHIPIVDIAILAAGFLLRVLYGSAITGIEISKWLYLTVVSMAFYLGLGKRRNELMRQSDGTTRPVLRFYTREFLDKNLYMCVALAIVFYSLWAVDPLTVERVGGSALVWTVPLVILICFRYSLDIEGPSDGDPVEVLTKDHLLLGAVLVFGLLVLGIVYL